jgi:hypothetical protein
MNASEIKVGKKYATKIGKNEVEVTVIGKTSKGWIVKTSAGHAIPINNAERFIKCLDTEATIVPESSSSPKPEASGLKPKLSMLDAAVQILNDALRPMSPKEIIAAMEEANLWKSPSGQTPANSLAAAAQREIANKEKPRFKKTGPGKFAIADKKDEVEKCQQ